MSTPGTVVLRRTWPQRLVILCSVGVIAGALAAAWYIQDVYISLTDIGRVEIPGELLFTDTAPGDPVNYLLVGEDSAAGLDPSDPVTFDRKSDATGHQADSITILRVDPTSGQAWVLSVPRDLLVERSDGREVKINLTYFVDGPAGLIEAVIDNFDIQINHYITLDFLGFREVVDELDGIPVWFDHPARDYDSEGIHGSGLDIPEAGCQVLDGVEALQYVRARYYQEYIDGDWEYVGNSDFGRIERQQDFLVLALSRAIDRGARDPVQLAALIGAGAKSIVLDDELTVAELVDVGQAFSDFDPENLERFALEVDTAWNEDRTRYLGERLKAGANEEIFDVFRGNADLPPATEVAFDLYASSDDAIAISTPQLEKLGFTVSSAFVLDGADTTTIVHPPGELAAAETIARWLEPIPRVVEDPDATSLSLVLGDDTEQILVFFPHEIPKMRRGVAGHDDADVPDLGDATPADTTTSSSSSSSTTAAPIPTITTAPPSTTTTIASDVPTTTAGIIGQAPEGESCG